MAYPLALQGAHAAAAPTLDPIVLHAQAVNGLSRCRRELLQPAPSYAQVLAQLDQARCDVAALAAVDVAATH